MARHIISQITLSANLARFVADWPTGRFTRCTSPIQCGQYHFLWSTPRQSLQFFQYALLETAMIAWLHLDDLAAANGSGWRGDAQDKTLPPRDDGWPLQPQLRPGLSARLQFIGVEEPHTGRDLLGATVEINQGVICQGPRSIRQQRKPHVAEPGGTQLSG